MQYPKNESPSPPVPAGSQSTNKAKYAAPELKVFGSVSKLTMGSGGSRLDGNGSYTNTSKP